MAKGRKTGGRTKGTKNKIPKTLREDVLEAFKQLGGPKFLMEAAVDAKTSSAFIALLGKCIPKEIEAHVEPIEVRWSGEKRRA
jgi:hypothetical protein